MYKYNPEIISDKTDEGFIEFVNKFYKDIEEIFNNNSYKFISYDINNDNITKLKKYLILK